MMLREDGGHASVAYQSGSASETGAVSPLSSPIEEVTQLQRQRAFCIKSQSSCDRSCESFIARVIGYSSPKTKDVDRSGEKERKALFARARAVRVAIEKGGQFEVESHVRYAPEADGEGQTVRVDQSHAALSVCAPIVINNAIARSAWDSLRKSTEKRMRQIAQELPAFAWISTIHGAAALGLAVIIGETGDLSNYATKGRVWKRLGLAPYKGRACSSWAAGGLTADEWVEAGYSKTRRGSIYADIGIPLFMAKSKNQYGQVYADRYAHTGVTHPEWTKGHRDNDARRIMTKAFIADLWKEWNSA